MEILEVEKVDFTYTSDGYKKEYRGKLVIDKNPPQAIFYFSKNGHSYWQVFGSDYFDGMTAKEFLKALAEAVKEGKGKDDKGEVKLKSTTSFDELQKLLLLKSAFTTDEIISLKKAKII